MRYPNLFYYTETQSTIHYSRMPTGSLAINKMIRGEPCWITPSLPRIEKKKFLILADWTAASWTTEKTLDVIRKLTELRNEGWVIYLWYKSHCRPMNNEDIADLEDDSIREDITFAPMQEIMNAAVMQHKIAPNTVHVLDDYWIKHLLSDKDELGPRELSIAEVESLLRRGFSSAIHANQFMLSLNTATPPLSKIIKDKLSDIPNASTLWFERKFKNIPIENDYTHIALNLPDEQSIQTALEQAGLFTSTEHPLQQIKSFYLLDSKVSWGYLSFIINKTPSLKQLVLINCKKIDGELTLETDCLKQLEEIDLYGSTISHNSLNALLLAAPKLKKLFLRKFTGTDGDLAFETNFFPQLKEIQVLCNTLSLKSINALLVAAPNLKKLGLENYLGIDDDLTLETDCLQKLTEIKISNSTLSLNNLKMTWSSKCTH